MNSQRAKHWSNGYTIIEVLIFLAVSGAMLSAAILLVGGQQEKTRFSTTVREVESKLSDIFNDVETGTYPSSGSIACSVNTLDPTAGPTLTGPVRPQGSNQDCLFLGKAIEFYRPSTPGSTVSSYRAFTIVGRRQTVSLTEVQNIAEAQPRAFDQIREEGSFPNGVEITQIRYQNGAVLGEGIAVLAPLGPFSALEPSIAASNGKPRLSTINFSNGFADNAATFRTAVSNISAANINQASQGAVICLRSAPGARVAAVAIGVESTTSGAVPFGQRLATQAYFDDEAADLGCSS